MGVGKFDPDLAIREGWARDQEDEVSFDGYNAFLQITTSDGSSGFSVTNSVGATAFRAKSDGDGYVAQNLGVGTESPTEKLDVRGVTKTHGLQVTTGPVDGYVLTSDSTGVATWQQAPGAASGITASEHRDLDQLVHDIAETSLDEYIYTNGQRVAKIITWANQTKTTKIRERLMTYSGSKTSQIVTIQYDGVGSEVERLTETFTYQGNNILNVERTYS